MTQLELLEIALKAITREIRKKHKSWTHLVSLRTDVIKMMKEEKEKNND